MAKWVPSHLNDPKREYQKKVFLSAGGDPEWIQGNIEADKLADAGTKLQAPPLQLVLREKSRQLITKAAQRMMVHIWAVHKGHLSVHREDGHEILVPDEEYGITDFEEPDWDQAVVPEEALEGIFADGPDDADFSICGLDDPP